MRPLLRLLAVVAVVLAAWPDGVHAQGGSDDDEREAPEVRKLQFRGVKAVDREELERSIATTASECRLLRPICAISKSPAVFERRYLDREEFRRDVLRLRVYYWMKGYREAQVDTAVAIDKNNRATITFAVTEGEPTRVRTVRVEYDSTVLPLKRVRRSVLLKAGAPLDLTLLDTTRVNLQGEMWERGYADARIDTLVTVDQARHVADIRIPVIANRRATVGTVTVRGNEDVDVGTIQNSLTLRRGEIFRRSDVGLSQRNLYESNLFRQAVVSVPAQTDSVKDVEITVQEGPHREARIAGGFNTVDFIQTEGRFSVFNLLGGARRLDLQGIAGNLFARTLSGNLIFRDMRELAELEGDPEPFLRPTWQASVELKQPAWLQRPRNSFAIGAFTHRRAAPGIFIDRGYGGSVTFTRLVRVRATASANYRFEIARVTATDIYFCVNYGVCDSETIGSLRRHQRLSPATISALVERTDDPLNPTKGYVARTELEHASRYSISDYRYNRGYLDAAAYTKLGPRRAVIAGHLRLGLVRALTASDTGIGILHPRKRFYAGGAQSVRGFGENQLGPRILTIPPRRLAEANAPSRTDPLRTPCDTTSAAGLFACNPNASGLKDGDFSPRPLGGVSLVEASVEWRVPIWEKFSAAVFVDGAIVGESAVEGFGDLSNIVRGRTAVTPGFGMRYRSPVGPIRIDLGINPGRPEPLRVVTELRENGVRRLVPVEAPRKYVSGSGSSGARGLLDRVVIHLSIGQAY